MGIKILVAGTSFVKNKLNQVFRVLEINEDNIYLENLSTGSKGGYILGLFDKEFIHCLEGGTEIPDMNENLKIKLEKQTDIEGKVWFWVRVSSPEALKDNKCFSSEIDSNTHYENVKKNYLNAKIETIKEEEICLK